MAKSHSKKSTSRRLTGHFLFGCLLLLITFFVGKHVILSTYHRAENAVILESQRVKNPEVTKINLSVTSKTTLADIASELSAAHIISDQQFFLLEAKLDQLPDFIPGEYTISSNMSSSKILELLTTAPKEENDTIKVTIPEGYTIEQIAESLQQHGVMLKEDFLQAIKTRDFSKEYRFLQEMPQDVPYKYVLEGYLFPDTYIIRKDASAEEIIVKMLDRFEEIYSTYASYAQGTPYTTHELITIASIIEQEARLDEERPMIAGVINNRLEAMMPLQMCSTVQYALNKRKTSLTYHDLEKDSPYNTYLQEGLPLGPICNPGEACIKAAVFPEQHDYLYFVVNDTQAGSHYFSQTLDEHNHAKQQYKQATDINFTE